MERQRTFCPVLVRPKCGSAEQGHWRRLGPRTGHGEAQAGTRRAEPSPGYPPPWAPSAPAASHAGGGFCPSPEASRARPRVGSQRKSPTASLRVENPLLPFLPNLGTSRLLPQGHLPSTASQQIPAPSPPMATLAQTGFPRSESSALDVQPLLPVAKRGRSAHRSRPW